MISARTIQAYLAAHEFYKGPIDGKIGPASFAAISNALSEAGIATKGWSPDRRIIAIGQLIMIEGGVPKLEVGAIDGYQGPMFDMAFEHWQDLQRIAPMWVPDHNPSKAWPMQKDVESYFGKPGTNLVSVRLPYDLFLAWNGQKIKSIQSNKRCAESLERVLLNVRMSYDELARRTLGLDQYSGGFVIRPMKTSSRLSMHAYGIAHDFDDKHNQLRWTQAQARFARAEYERWWKCWEDEGWISLGRQFDMDYMHVQAARPK
jgi:hypothetical protein